MSKKAVLNTQIFKITELFPADYNPRKDLQKDDLEYKQLKKSIKEFDYVDPLIFNRKTSTLISGHQRLKVLKDLGYTEIEVNCVDLEPNKEKALNIALNKIQGEWDNQKLADILKEFTSLEGFDIEIIGFNNNLIDDLLNQFDLNNDFDEIPFENDFADGTKKGQTIKKLIFGKHKIPLSDEELENLEKEYQNYIAKSGVEFGFVNHLLSIAA